MNAHTDAVHLGAYYENVIYHLLILYIIEHKYVIYSLNKQYRHDQQRILLSTS